MRLKSVYMGKHIRRNSKYTARIEPLEPRRMLAATVIAEFVPQPWWGPNRIRAAGNLHLFTMDVGEERQVWVTDGTSAGTHMLPGTGDYPADFVAYKGAAFFFAGDALWRTDGSAAGTARVIGRDKDRPFDGPSGLAVVGEHLMFVDRNGHRPSQGSGARVWQTDGTERGTTLVFEAAGATEGRSRADAITPLGNGTAVFAMRHGEIGEELWRTDGTAAGTSLLMDIAPNGSSYPTQFTRVGEHVFFSASRAAPGEFSASLWKTDGTAAGTVRVSQVEQVPRPTAVVGNTMYFVGDTSDGWELWKTDGTPGGTRIVKDIFPGSSELGRNSSSPVELTAAGGLVYFTAQDADHGRQLWRTDGTDAGTIRLTDLSGTGQQVNPFNFASINDTFFFASEPVTTGFDGPAIIYKSDGTPQGTRAILSHFEGRPLSSISAFSNVGGALVFADKSSGSRLLRWDDPGTLAGNVFADVAADGLRNAGDYMVGGFRVFLDRNGDGWWNRNEIFTRTNELGRYTLSDVPAGLYWLRVTNIGGWRFTTNDALRVRVTPGGEVIRHFGVTRNVLILGSVFLDANLSGGKDAGEAGLVGWTVFADADRDGVLDPDEVSVRTNGSGRYAIRTLAGGTHRIRLIQDTRYAHTAPAAGFRNVSLLPGAVATSVNFGQARI